MRLVLWADNDAASQEAQIRELLAAEVDALVVAPVDVYSLEGKSCAGKRTVCIGIFL